MLICWIVLTFFLIRLLQLVSTFINVCWKKEKRRRRKKKKVSTLLFPIQTFFLFYFHFSLAPNHIISCVCLSRAHLFPKRIPFFFTSLAPSSPSSPKNSSLLSHAFQHEIRFFFKEKKEIKKVVPLNKPHSRFFLGV